FDLNVFARSLNEVVRRHEILRTRFALSGTDPIQVIEPRLEIALKVHDLSDRAADSRDRAPREFCREEAQWPFDLSTGPLLRAAVVRLGAEDHIFLLNLHHIVCDGWSIRLVWSELRQLYEAFSKREA